MAEIGLQGSLTSTLAILSCGATLNQRSTVLSLGRPGEQHWSPTDKHDPSIHDIKYRAMKCLQAAVEAIFRRRKLFFCIKDHFIHL